MTKSMMLSLLLAAGVLFGCVNGDYEPYLTHGTKTLDDGKEYDQVTLQRTACFGFCPVYKVSVDERDIVVFEGERFVAEEGGSVSKRLPEGSFKKLLHIAKSHRFSSFDAAYPDNDGGNCAQIATDMPAVILGYDTAKLDHEVRFYQGCMGFEGRERLEDMIGEVDAVLDIGDWIGPRENFAGKTE